MTTFNKITHVKKRFSDLLQKYWFNLAFLWIVIVILSTLVFIPSTKQMTVTTPPPTPIADSTLYTIEGSLKENIQLEEIVSMNKNNQDKTGIYIYKGGFPYAAPTRYKNYILQVDYRIYISEFNGSRKTNQGISKTYSQIRGVNVYNIETGKKFNIRFTKPIVNDTAEYWSGQVVDDQYYYFGPGWELTNSSEYRIQLPPHGSSSIEYLTQPLAGNIKKIGKYHYLANCYEGCFYTFLDLEEQRNSTFSFNYQEYELEQAERVIGFNLEGEPVFAKREERSLQLRELGKKDPISGLYTKLIDVKELPEKMSTYVVLPETDIILMAGMNVYIYNLHDKILSKLSVGSDLIYPLSFANAETTADEIKVCNYGKSSSPTAYVIDLKNKIMHTTESTNNTCSIPSIEDPIEKLKLDKKIFSVIPIEET